MDELAWEIQVAEDLEIGTSPEDTERRARFELHAGRSALSLDAWEVACASPSPRARLGLGWALHSFGRYARARQVLEKAVEALPEGVPKARALIHLGQHDQVLGASTSAVEAFQAAGHILGARLRDCPDDVVARYLLGRALLREGRVHTERARAETAQTLYRRAEPEFARVAQVLDDRVMAPHGLANVTLSISRLQAGTGRPEEAARNYERAAELACGESSRNVLARVTFSEAATGLLQLCQKAGKLTDALAWGERGAEALEVGLVSAPESLELQLALELTHRIAMVAEMTNASAERSVQTHERAVRAYEAALGPAPSEVFALLNMAASRARLAVLYDEFKRRDDAVSSSEAALSFARTSLQSAPEHVWALRTFSAAAVCRAQILSGFERTQESVALLTEAREALDRAIAVAPEHAEVRAHRDELSAVLDW